MRRIPRLAIAGIVASVFLGGCSPAYTPSSSASPADPYPNIPVPNPLFTLPDADLAAAGLTAAKSAVTPLDGVVTAGGQTVRLAAGYADPTRIVLVFRTLPDVGTPRVQILDDMSPINATYLGAR